MEEQIFRKTSLRLGDDLCRIMERFEKNCQREHVSVSQALAVQTQVLCGYLSSIALTVNMSADEVCSLLKETYAEVAESNRTGPAQ